MNQRVALPTALLAVAVSLLLLGGSLIGAPVAGAASPDGGKIAFTSWRDGNYEVYVMNADGTGQTNLTNNPAWDHEPAWSPDGAKIAFTSDRDGNNEIYVMNANGTGQTRLTNNLASDVLPAWSPDGTKIAFTSSRAGNYEIYVMKADGTDPTRLTYNPELDYQPAWSPDGSKIAFMSSLAGNYEIYVMNADGTDRVNLTNHPATDLGPAWSPDGTKIAFTSSRIRGAEIYIMNADGTEQANLTDNWYWELKPTWSPDGSKIAFTSDRDGNNEIHVLNADGTGQTNLTNNPEWDGEPAWGVQALVVAPLAAITAPKAGDGVQDGFTFTATLSDGTSGPDSMSFSVREDDNTADGKAVGFENLSPEAGDCSEASGTMTCSLSFDTTKLPDGYYLLLVKGYDKVGNAAEATLSFKIVNWAAMSLLPATEESQAGRKMPVKFSLRDSLTNAFVENQQLLIKIYEEGTTTILQSSTYGTKSTDYRMDNVAEQYITNFQTAKTPKTYVVEVWRTATKPMLISSFVFNTTK